MKSSALINFKFCSITLNVKFFCTISLTKWELPRKFAFNTYQVLRWICICIFIAALISVRRKSCQRKSSFPQLTLLHLLFSEKLRGMVEAPNFISEKNISYCLQRVIQSQSSKTSPSLRKNSRKSPSLARRGILGEFLKFSINSQFYLSKVHCRPNFR